MNRFPCPSCGDGVTTSTRVIFSRRDMVMRRQRHCLDCDASFETIEIISLDKSTAARYDAAAMAPERN